MAKEKEILRLRSLSMSQKAIMASVRCASRKVKNTFDKADELNITYEMIKDKSEDEVEEIFGNKKEVNYLYERPDCDYIHKELLKPGVTVMLLWEEYVEKCKLYMTGGESHYVRYMRATTKPLVRATSSVKRASPCRLAF